MKQVPTGSTEDIVVASIFIKVLCKGLSKSRGIPLGSRAGTTKFGEGRQQAVKLPNRCSRRVQEFEPGQGEASSGRSECDQSVVPPLIEIVAKSSCSSRESGERSLSHQLLRGDAWEQQFEVDQEE